MPSEPTTPPFDALTASRAVPCPRCLAPPGEPCHTTKGVNMPLHVHRARFAIAVKLRKGALGAPT